MPRVTMLLFRSTLLLRLLTLRAHIFRCNGGMGLNICMYPDPRMKQKMKQKISAKKTFLSNCPHALKAHISGSNGPQGLNICRNTQPYVGEHATQGWDILSKFNNYFLTLKINRKNSSFRFSSSLRPCLVV